MTTILPRARLFRYLLLFLIAAFFAIPISALYLFDCKLYPKKIASVLLFFFR